MSAYGGEADGIDRWSELRLLAKKGTFVAHQMTPQFGTSMLEVGADHRIRSKLKQVRLSTPLHEYKVAALVAVAWPGDRKRGYADYSI